MKVVNKHTAYDYTAFVLKDIQSVNDALENWEELK